MMRLDAEVTNDLSVKEEEKLKDLFSAFINNVKPDIVILQDYNKGVLTTDIIDFVLTSCKKNDIRTAVDPKRKNFFEFKGADVFKPNLKEAKDALNLLFPSVTPALLEDIHAQLRNLLQHHISLITLSEKGVFYK